MSTVPVVNVSIARAFTGFHRRLPRFCRLDTRSAWKHIIAPTVGILLVDKVDVTLVKVRIFARTMSAVASSLARITLDARARSRQTTTKRGGSTSNARGRRKPTDARAIGA